MDITTYNQLEGELNKICEIVVDNVSKSVLDKLKEAIKRDVYDAHGPNKMYRDFSENDSEFYNAWEWSQIQKATKSLSREILYNWQKMKFEPRNYVHTDYLSGQDTRSRLNEILNVNGFDNGIGQGNPLSVQRYAYWNSFIVDMTLGGEMLDFFDREFGRFGIKR